jgi:hypothetical protein
VNANTMNLRGVMVSGRQIVRLTVPAATPPTGRQTIVIPGQGSLPVAALPWSSQYGGGKFTRRNAADIVYGQLVGTT